MNKQEILRKHLGQSPEEFQDLGKKNTLDAMEEYAVLYHKNEVKTLGLLSVVQRSELLILFFNWITNRIWYSKNQYDPKEAVDLFIKQNL